MTGGEEVGTAVQIGLGPPAPVAAVRSRRFATPGPGVIERTDNVKTALTQMAQQVSSSGQRMSLTWRMNSGDGFLPMALLKAEPDATVRVEMMDGGWSSGDGSAEWSFEFNGTPEEATHLRGFIEGRGAEAGRSPSTSPISSTMRLPCVGMTAVRPGSPASPEQV